MLLLTKVALVYYKNKILHKSPRREARGKEGGGEKKKPEKRGGREKREHGKKSRYCMT